MQDLSIDIETYSEVDIRKSGLYKYGRDPFPLALHHQASGH